MTTPLLLCAGLDPTGGAGLIADAATARASGCFPLVVPTMLTRQNSLRFDDAAPVDPLAIERTVALLADEFAFDTAKVGLIPVADAAWLDRVGSSVRARCRRIVIDPVLKATAAAEGGAPDAAFLRFIAGPGTVVTPNRRELAALAALTGTVGGTVEREARALCEATGAAVVVTFEGEEPRSLIFDTGGVTEVPVTLLPLDRPVRGTGCRFSTALAAALAQGRSLPEAVTTASAHLTALLAGRTRFHPDGQDYIDPVSPGSRMGRDDQSGG